MRFILLFLVIASFAFGQGNQVWKYKDSYNHERSGWHEDGKYLQWTTTGADSIYSQSFGLDEEFNGLLRLAVQVDTVTGTNNVSFVLQINDGLDWVSYNSDLNFWLSTDSSTVVSAFNDGTDGNKYYWTSYKADEDKGMQSLPYDMFRVKMKCDGNGTWRIRMSWAEY